MNRALHRANPRIAGRTTVKLSFSPRLGAWLALALCGGLSACTQSTTVTRIEPTSFRVHIVCAGTTTTLPDGGTFSPDCPAVTPGASVCPANPGAVDLGLPEREIDRSQSFYMAQVTAIDSLGNVYPNYNGTANVHIQFEGSVTPARGTGVPPLATLPFVNGQACLTLAIPQAFNQTAIWVEDPPVYTQTGASPNQRAVSGSYALGASEAIYRPAPLITDIQYTNDAVYQTSGLNNKHVIVNSGTGGSPMVVTYVTTSYFTVTDLGAPGPDHAWGSLELYTYSQPFGVKVGQTVSGLNGGVSNYLGLPELNFPIWGWDNATPDLSLIPAPHRVYYADIPQTIAKMAPYKSAIVTVKSDSTDTWVVCALRGNALTSYYKYQEWLISAPSGDCSSWSESMDVVSTASLPNFDPIANAGKKICSLSGILTVVVPAAHVNLWTITPRDASDLGAVVPLSQPCP